jgi:hypothetical protein
MVAVCILLGAREGGTGYKFFFEPSGGRLGLLDSQLRHVGSILLGAGAPSGTVVDPSGEIVVRSSDGLAVFAQDGSLRRQLLDDPGRGLVAYARPGWVVTSVKGEIVALSIDGRERRLVDAAELPSAVRTLGADRFAVSVGHDLRIYSGWPPKLEKKMHLPADITVVEPISAGKLVVATTASGERSGRRLATLATAALYEYALPDLRLESKRLLEDVGLAHALRRIGDELALVLLGCYAGQPDVIRFLKADLTDSSRPELTIDGPTSLATSGDHLLIALSACGTLAAGANGSLLDYDVTTRKVTKLLDGPYLVFETDGS